MLVLCILFLASYWHVGVAGWDGVREGWQDAPGDWTVQPLTYTRSSSPTQVMAAGGNHACAITQRGTLCWGANWDGQLGTPQAGEVCFHHSGELPACSRSPQRVLSDRDFVWISAGGEHSCAIDTQGRAFCWGWNGYGQIGGPTDDGCVGPYQPTLSAPVNPCTYIPVQVTGHLTSQLRFAKIAAGGAHTCGVGVDGVAYCWGRNDSYQTGSTTSAATCDFDRPCNPDPVRVSGFYTVTAGTHHSCGIYSNGVAYCWGSNKDGQLGRGDIVMDRCGSGADEYWCSATPRLVMGGHRFATIDAADDHTCGVTVEGDAYCWGRNEYGELGDGLSFVGTVYYTPNLVVGGHRFVTIETGLSSTCGVTERGVTLCWGLAEYGEIGDGQTTPRNQSSPLPVDSSVRFHSVSSLGLFNCATDGTAVYCWGQNDFGQSGPTFQELCRGAFPCNVKPAFATGLGFGPPEIGALWIRGSKDPKHPMTTYDVELEAEIDMMPGYEISQVSWSGDLNPGLGNPYSYEPERATHGLKEIVATLTFTHTGSGGLGQVSREGEFKLFFEKDGDDNADGNPNWFDYWGVDGAVFGLDALDVKFDATITAELGKYNRVADTIFLGPKAAQPDPIAVEIEGPNCPRLTWGPYLLGIDRAAAVLAHERRHEAIYGYWDFTAADSCASPSGPWGGCRDSDRGVIQYWYDDRLPDAYELEVTGTSPEQVDSCGLGNLRGLEPVKYYGDQEYDARWHEQGHSGVPERDWANPGAQAEPVWLQGSDPVGRVASGSAVEGKSGGPTAGFVSAGQGTAVFPDLAELTGHYVDAGVDSDGDGLFDALRIEAGLTVTTPAVYEVVGWLQDDQGGEIAWASHRLDLDAGLHTAQLDLPGPSIQQFGADGPYQLARIELRVGEQADLADQVENAYTTAGYAAAEFEPPSVTFTEVYTSAARDTDGDALYDLLSVGVGLEVHDVGGYRLTSRLYDADGNSIPGAVATTPFSATGMVTLEFAGENIRWARADGPFTVRYVQVRDANQERIGLVDVGHTTSPYTYDQFQYRGAAVDMASFSDQGQDGDFDGDYDYVRVKFQIDADQAGVYRLHAALIDGHGKTLVTVEQSLGLSAGANDVTLDFPATAIARYEVDGPYQVAWVTLLDSRGDIIEYQPLAHQTGAYDHSDFSLLVGPIGASLRDYPDDVDGDGTVDYLKIDVPASPATDGMMVVEARLFDKNGREIQALERYEWYESWYTPGPVFTMTLPFSAGLILANGVDGPYSLRDLRVYHTLNPAQDLRVPYAHTTAYYTLPDWGVIDLDEQIYLPLVLRE